MTLQSNTSWTGRVLEIYQSLPALRASQAVPPEGIASLSPAYFAMVMATGIVSIAAELFSLPWFAMLLFYINITAYIVLCVLYGIRFFKYHQWFLLDFTDPSKCPAYLTFVAGTCILGTQFILLAGKPIVSMYLFFIALVAWVFLIYAFFTLVAIKQNKPTIDKSISGLWMLTIVSTQALSILGTQLCQMLPFGVEKTLFFSLFMFFCGCMFYIILITLTIYRVAFFEMTAESFAPAFWINMGAVAITTLAGSMLLLNANKWDFLQTLVPFLIGFTMFFWAMSTWWIPLIVILGIWRHIVRKLPLRYHPQYWGMVFPLGMYTVCTMRLSEALHLEFVKEIPTLFVFIAIAAWLAAFLSMIYEMASKIFTKS
ncbi:MAG: tellurite resistance/C4-dicarboxylate transporter family protein [Abditibacteriaceae bacterium]